MVQFLLLFGGLNCTKNYETWVLSTHVLNTETVWGFFKEIHDNIENNKNI